VKVGRPAVAIAQQMLAEGHRVAPEAGSPAHEGPLGNEQDWSDDQPSTSMLMMFVIASQEVDFERRNSGEARRSGTLLLQRCLPLIQRQGSFVDYRNEQTAAVVENRKGWPNDIAQNSAGRTLMKERSDARRPALPKLVYLSKLLVQTGLWTLWYSAGCDATV